MAITASMVKELREMTGAGMMDCKKALTETNGDMDAAVEVLKKSGAAKMEKKASRIAAEGLCRVIVKDDTTAAVVEVNSETDFVAKNEQFSAFVAHLAEIVAETNPATVEELMTKTMKDGNTVEAGLQEKILVIGENIKIRRFERLEGGRLIPYVHGEGRIGVLVEAEGSLADEAAYEAARDVAMQAAAMNPIAVNRDSVPEDVVAHEKEMIKAEMKNDEKNKNKPEDILEKMAVGKLGKFFKIEFIRSQHPCHTGKPQYYRNNHHRN